MAVRPKTRPNNGIVGEPPAEDVSCGYVMHQYKSLKCKMRWGQLWTGQNEDGRRRCTIRLFKFDIANPKPGTFTKKDLRLKLCFEFNEDDFCGLEKGEHYTRNGMRRYVCIILRDKHLIVQDAITALTDTDHNVIGTWYRKVSETMYYINRWRVYGDENSNVRFLHLTRENLCECYSLHNSHAGQKGKILLVNLYKTKEITNLYETQETCDGELCTRITFYDKQRGLDVKNTSFVYGVVKLASILSRVSVNPGGVAMANGGKLTLCPRFDDLNVNTNLVKVTPPKKKSNPPPRNLKELSGADRGGVENHYVLYDTDPESHVSPPANLVPSFPVRNVDSNTRERFNGAEQNGINRMKFSPTNPFASPSGPAPRPHSERSAPPPPTPPRDPTDDGALGKKAPELATQRSVDSGFETGYMTMGENSSTTNEPRIRISNESARTNDPRRELGFLENYEGPYRNILDAPLAQTPQSRQFIAPDAAPQLHAAHASATPTIPPRMSQRDVPDTSDTRDLLRDAIETDTLPPVIAEGDPAMPGYENSMRGCDIEVTIGEILKGAHHEVRGRSFGLPYSAYMALVLGLEKDSVADGNWRGLASALGLQLRDVEQIESVISNHSNLLPAEIVLLHWQRTEAPYPYTRESLHGILSQVIGRLDLASLIPLDEEKETKNGDGEGNKVDDAGEGGDETHEKLGD